MPQSATGITYAAKVTKEEGRLDWSRTADELDRLVRAFPAWFEWQNERFRVLDAESVPGQGDAGRVLDDHLTIACGQGALRLLTLQRAGRAAVDAESFLRGFPLPQGSCLCPVTS